MTLRYLLVDGNYPLISWMAFPLMGILFWQTAGSRGRTAAWVVGSLGVSVVTYVVAVYAAPVGGMEELRRWIASGWTPTSAIFLITAGGGALVVVSTLLQWWGTRTMPRVVQPLVLFGRASLSHYVLHIAIAYSVLRLFHPDEDWVPRTGLWAMAAYLAIGVPLTVFWFRHYTHGPLEMLWARVSRRPHRAADEGNQIPRRRVEVIRDQDMASLHAVQCFQPGEVVVPLEGDVVPHPTRFTIQIGVDTHLDPISDLISPWGSLNHGCDPNVTIDVQRRAIVARRAIAAGEQLRFDYNTTEWELAESFLCNCGAPWCVGVARGFAHLSSARQRVMLREAAPHVRTLYAAQVARRLIRVEVPRPDLVARRVQLEPSRTGSP